MTKISWRLNVKQRPWNARRFRKRRKGVSRSLALVCLSRVSLIQWRRKSRSNRKKLKKQFLTWAKDRISLLTTSTTSTKTQSGKFSQTKALLKRKIRREKKRCFSLMFSARMRCTWCLRRASAELSCTRCTSTNCSTRLSCFWLEGHLLNLLETHIRLVMLKTP